MNNNSYKRKITRINSYFAKILIALMMLQVLPVTFAAKSGNNAKGTLAKIYNNKGSKGKTSNNKTPNVNPSLQLPSDLVVVRHGVTIDGSRVDGSVRVLLPESTSLNGTAIITGDILTPGSPNIVLGSNVKFNGVVTGTGNTQPSNYNVNLNSNSSVGHIVTRTDAISINPVADPLRSKATRDVVLSPGQSPGDFTTIRNLSLNPNYGSLTVPPGIYGSLSANNSTFVFGVAGQSTTYNLQGLNLSNNAELQILGVVTINVQGNVVLSSQAKMGVETSPIALALNIASGNVTLDNSTLYGIVKTPNGQVSLNTNALLKGLVTCDSLSANSNSKIQGLVSDTTQPIVSILEPTTGQFINAATTVVAGSFQDISLVTSVNVNNITATINNSNYTSTIPLTNGNNTITVTATDIFGNIGIASVNVTVNTTPNQAPIVNAGTDQSIILPINNVTLNGIVTDDELPQGVDLTVSWSKVSSPTGGTVTFSNSSAAETTATFNIAGTYVLKLEANDKLLSASDTITVVVNEPQQNQAPVVNAGTDQTITLPNGVTLNGTVTDDGLPNPPSQLSITWSKVSGSGTVTFSSPSTAATSATFSQAGTYVLRLSATDSSLTNTDEVTVIVNPAQSNNTAPVVNAGNDQTINLPSVATLQGQVSDDGNPNPPGQLSITWTRVDGPGVVNFTNPNGAITQASFAIAGTYTLRLTVSDSVLSTSDDVIIIANGAANQAPTVNAGVDQTILLPEIIILTGTVSDDGVPSSTLTLTWSKVSGPGAVTFTDPSALSTSVVFDAAGVYRLKLTASDGQFSGSDEVEVTLNIRKQITIYSHGYGFDPEELTVKAGEKSLMIRNRTGLEVTYVFTQGSQSLSVTALPGKTAIIDATLEVGTASLTATGHSDWNCQVTIIP